MTEERSPDSSSNDFDADAYVRRMVAETGLREREARRRERQPYVSISIRLILSLLWTPLVIFCTYAVRWTSLIPYVDGVGLQQTREWPLILGSVVITAYSAFYGIAAGLGTKGNEESRRVAVGSFYGFWVWLPMFLIYPGTQRLQVSSDDHGAAAFVLIGLGQTIFVWFIARWSQLHIKIPRTQ